MIHLFRNIRKSLLSEGKTRNYFKYAVGEILLVVVGILIALSINNWNTEVQNSKQEKYILKQLKHEYLTNLLQLKEKIGLRDEMIKSSFKLLNYYEKGIKYEEINDFDKNLARTAIAPTYDPASGVTNELINSGKLYLLKNEELRIKLTTWSGYLLDLSEEETILLNFTTNRYAKFIIDNYQIKNVLKESFKDSVFVNRYKLTNSNLSIITDKKGSPDKILSNPDFEDHVLLIVYYCDYINDQSRGIQKKMENILKLIDQELLER